MAEENIDNTVNGTGLFNTKIPGLSDAADIQAALRLYHYGTYTYDGANTNPAILPVPSMAKHLQNLVDADAAEVVNRNAAITAHNASTTNVHGILNTALLATKEYVDTEILDAIDGATGAYSELAGTGLDWNSADDRFDVEPRISNINTLVTKTSNFTLELNDVSKTILIDSSSEVTVTIPTNANVAIPVGYQFNLIRIGSGFAEIRPSAAPIYLKSKASNIVGGLVYTPVPGMPTPPMSLPFVGQYSKITILKIDTDIWVAYGDIDEESIVNPTQVTPVTPSVTPAVTPAVTLF